MILSLRRLYFQVAICAVLTGVTIERSWAQPAQQNDAPPPPAEATTVTDLTDILGGGGHDVPTPFGRGTAWQVCQDHLHHTWYLVHGTIKRSGERIYFALEYRLLSPQNTTLEASHSRPRVEHPNYLRCPTFLKGVRQLNKVVGHLLF